MTIWRAAPSPLRFALPVLVLLCAVVAAWLWARLSERTAAVTLDPGVYLLALGLALMLFVAGMSAYALWCVLTMRYTLDASTLTVLCGPSRWRVPFAAITGVFAPDESVDGAALAVSWRGRLPPLPGYMVGWGSSARLGRVFFVTSAPPGGQVLVRTVGLTYGLSPQNASKFVSTLETLRKAASPVESPGISTSISLPWRWSATLWSDPSLRRLLMVGLLLNVLFFGYLGLVYGNLPSRLSLHWNALAEVDRVGSPLELVRLPVFGLALWLLNTLLAYWAAHRERALALFLVAGGVAAQLVLWFGALLIVLRAG